MGSVMAWYRWPSLQAFTAWHAAACDAMAIPHPNKNAATGEVNHSAQWTVAAVAPVVIADDDVRAYVPIDVPTVDGLGDESEPPPQEEVTEP